MQDLAPVGLTEDGTCLLLVTAAGEKFLLPVDDQLQRLVGSSRRSAAPLDTPDDPAGSPAGTSSAPAGSPSSPASAPARPATGPTPTRRSTTSRQQEPSMDSALRPRDIQARVRAGESAETVAAAAGTSVEAIMPYASPVLAERAHQAQVALKASVRRGAGPAGGARALGDAVDQFLGSQGLDDSAVEWDSWRRQDGRWALTARLESGGRTLEAAFVHDVAGRYVVADNDDAKTLIGETVAGAPAPAVEQPPARRLSAVSDAGARPRDPGTPGDAHRDPSRDSLGDDAIALVRDRRDEPTVLDRAPRDVEPEEAQPQDADEPTVEVGADPSDAALDDVTADDDPIHQPADVPILGLGETDSSPVRDEVAPAPDRAEATDVAVDAPAEPPAESPDDQPALDLGVAAPEAGEEQEKPRRGRKGRASVPSWDEIMFGGGAAGPTRADDQGQDRSEDRTER